VVVAVAAARRAATDLQALRIPVNDGWRALQWRCAVMGAACGVAADRLPSLETAS
jgi:hypothetical protein